MHPFGLPHAHQRAHEVTAAAFRLEGVRSMQIAHTGRFNARPRAL